MTINENLINNSFLKDSIKTNDKNNVKLLFDLAVKYEEGNGCKQNYSKAVEIYKFILKNKNDTDSAYNLANLYQEGKGITKDLDEAIKLYKLAIDMGDTDSLVKLAILYKNKYSTKKNYDLSYQLLMLASGFEKVLSIEYILNNNIKRVMYKHKLGNIIYKKNKLNTDYFEIKYDDKSSDIIYYDTLNSKNLECKGDNCFEYIWLEGNKILNRHGVNQLAQMYYSGEGCKRNIENSIYLYQKIATFNKKYKNYFIKKDYGCKYAQFNLGRIYIKGSKNINRNVIESLKWYTLSAEQGYELAQLYLGELYDKGIHVRQSYHKAFRWYLKAAIQGNIRAQYNVACMYDLGEGIKQSNSQALLWYKSSAKLKCNNSLINLGLMYQVGQGIEKNYTTALNYYLDALYNGDINAKKYILNLCYENLNIL